MWAAGSDASRVEERASTKAWPMSYEAACRPRQHAAAIEGFEDSASTHYNWSSVV